MSNFDWLSRTELLTGREKLEQLASKKVLIVGLGGIGSFAAEAICRAGIQDITIVDGDTVEASNRNRQLVALTSTTDKAKADVMAERMKDINPDVKLTVIKEFLTPEALDKLITNEFDYILECIDSITPKETLLRLAKKKRIPIVCSGGAGGKTDPTKVEVMDISKVYNDKMIKYVRKRLKKDFKYLRGIKVVFSTEVVDKNSLVHTDGSNYKRSAYGTMSYLPAIFGLTVASVAIRDLMDQ